MKKELLLFSTDSETSESVANCLETSGLNYTTAKPEKAPDVVKGKVFFAIIWASDTSIFDHIESIRSNLQSYTYIILLTEDGPCKMDFNTWSEDFIVVKKGDLKELSLALKQMPCP